MPKRAKSLANVVVISAYNLREELVESLRLTYEAYYDGNQPLIDDPDYRRKKHIRKVSGTIYDPKGSVDQQFEMQYDGRGRHVRGHAIHKDGTVTKS